MTPRLLHDRLLRDVPQGKIDTRWAKRRPPANFWSSRQIAGAPLDRMLRVGDAEFDNRGNPRLRRQLAVAADRSRRRRVELEPAIMIGMRPAFVMTEDTLHRAKVEKLGMPPDDYTRVGLGWRRQLLSAS